MTPDPATRPSEERDRAPAVLVWIALLAGAWLRLRGAATAPFFGDEFHSLPLIELPLSQILRTFDEFGSHVPLPLLQHLSFELLGPSPLAARCVALAPGIATLPLVFVVSRPFIGATAAALATLFVALNPLHVYYSQFARSYALAGCLGLALVGLARPFQATGARLGPALATTVVAGVLGWVHLATGGFVAAVALVALATAPDRRVRLRTLAVFGAALALTVALHAPAWTGLATYLESHTGHDAAGSVGALDVATIVAGGPGIAWVVLALIGASLLFVRQCPDGWVWIVTAALGPIVALALSRPVGMAYAWARYLIVGLPFLAGWAAWSLHRAGARPLGSRGVLALGTAALVTAACCGPLASRWDAHPFSNSYLALRRLPAFDERWPEVSPLYAQLAADPSVTRIIEAPQLVTRSVLLLRHHRLVHGKEVDVGWIGPGSTGLTRAYVRIDEDASLAAANADVLVFHKHQQLELERYWTFVYDQAWPIHERASDRSFMERHRALWKAYGPLPGVVQRLRDRLGEPFYEDDLVVGWRLGRS